MKKYITFLLLIAAISVKAQTTVVTSKALGDLITLQKGAFEITPIFVTLTDSARSMSYSLINVSRDTTSNFIGSILLYNKSGTIIASRDVIIPGNFFLKWSGFITKLDTYLLKNRLVKQ